MANKIIAGRFAGKRIKLYRGTVYIPFSRERMFLSDDIVDHIRLINITRDKSFTSGWMRGSAAKRLGKTAWLSAIQSAKNKNRYNIKIVYRDGSASVGLVDFHVFEVLAASYDLK